MLAGSARKRRPALHADEAPPLSAPAVDPWAALGELPDALDEYLFPAELEELLPASSSFLHFDPFQARASPAARRPRLPAGQARRL